SASGLLTGVEVGNTTLTATKDGVTSNTVDVNVSAAVITAIQVTPSPVNVAKGQTQQLVADATYSDGTSSPITNSVTWIPIDTATTTVSASGLLTGVEVGNTTLTANKDGVTSNTVDVNVSAAVITAIQVTPSPVNVAKGQTQQLTATATYSDGTSSGISSEVTWLPDDTATATVSASGLLTGVEVGNTTLTATKDGVTSNIVGVNVSTAVITAIQVTPSPVNVAKGQTQQLVADATYSDGTSSPVTNSVTWIPIDTATTTVSASGLLTGVEAGNTTLTATKDGVTSNTVDVNVSAAVITAIQVTPSLVNVAKGLTQQLTATATYSDGTSSGISSEVTWIPDDTATATVSASGLLTGVEVGNTILTGTKDGVTSNTVDVNVCELPGACIDIFDTGTGKLYTNSPSVAYLDSIGGSATNGTVTEDGSYGPVGDFYLFDWTNANALCTTYNTLSLGGRTNWRLGTKDELKTELYDVSGNMFTARGWPTLHYYWTATPDGSNNYCYEDLSDDGESNCYLPSSKLYASCVSNP
uniref:Ig-like domain-containing protein n=1 Tax=uncultured Shewanella sp. TaxID=173975 RepID=UPI00260C68DD